MNTQPPLSIKTVRIDLAATKRDITNLKQIVKHLEAFCNDPEGHGRSASKAHLFIYKTYLSQAENLLPKIESKLTELRNQ